MNKHTRNTNSYSRHLSVGHIVLCAAALLSVPGFAYAQFVPVLDSQLNSSFNSYSSTFSQFKGEFKTFSGNFDKYAENMDKILAKNPDSIRDIITGADPQGVALDACKKGPAGAAFSLFAYDTVGGPWKTANASSSGRGPQDLKLGGSALPLTIPAGGPAGGPPPSELQVNTSGSLRCLLQDLVGWQKLSIHIQMQTMLKQYVSDAQQKQLANQMLNEIHAANLNWSKQANVVTSNNVTISEPTYITNINQTQYNRNERTVNNLVHQVNAAPGDPIGSLETCEPLKDATRLATGLRDEAQDPSLSTAQATECNLYNPSGPFANPADMDEYMIDPNTTKGLGAPMMLLYQLGNPQDFEVSRGTVLDSIATQRLEQQKANSKEARTSSGVGPTMECSGDPGDPDCDPAKMVQVSPAAQNSETLTQAANQGNRQLEQANAVDTAARNAAGELSTRSNTEGALNYDPTSLANSTVGVNALIQELYDTIDTAYFDIGSNRKEWAEASLLMIYDEMKFDDTSPRSVVTAGQAAAPVPDP